jgi:hypothetical protein
LPSELITTILCASVIMTNNSVALPRERTIPIERPLLASQVRANFLLIEGVAWSAQRIPTAVILVF